MKIAFIFPRITGPYGGERLMFTLAKELTYLGAEITIYSSFNDKDILDIDHSKVKLIKVGGAGLGGHQLKTLLDFIKMPIFASRVSKNHDYVVGMGWQTSFCLFILTKLRRFNKRSVIYYCLEPPRFLYDLKEESSSSKIKSVVLLPLFSLIKFLDAISIKALPRNYAISQWSSDQMKAIYGKRAPIIYPGVEIERFKNKSKPKAREHLSLSKNGQIFITVSKLHARKKIQDSIDLYLKNESTNSKYFIIGNGPDKANIEEYIKQTQSKSITLLGTLSDEEVAKYMIAADYFIFTAVNEPFGIAPLEAEVAGCKILPKQVDQPILDWPSIAKIFLNSLTSG